MIYEISFGIEKDKFEEINEITFLSKIEKALMRKGITCSTTKIGCGCPACFSCKTMNGSLEILMEQSFASENGLITECNMILFNCNEPWWKKAFIIKRNECTVTEEMIIDEIHSYLKHLKINYNMVVKHWNHWNKS